MHTATSHGYALNSPFYHWLLHASPTIFNRIEDKKDPALTWKVYYDKLDIVSLTGLQNPDLWKYSASNFKYMEDFKQMPKKEPCQVIHSLTRASSSTTTINTRKSGKKFWKHPAY